jgi:hypothetical protein
MLLKLIQKYADYYHAGSIASTIELAETKLGTLPLSVSAGSSKLKIRTSSWHKAHC